MTPLATAVFVAFLGVAWAAVALFSLVMAGKNHNPRRRDE